MQLVPNSCLFHGHESALPRHGFEGKKSPKRALWLPRVSRLRLDLARLPACLGAVGDFRASYSLLSALRPFLFLFPLISWAWVEKKSPKTPNGPPCLDLTRGSRESNGSRWETSLRFVAKRK
jgi:hypothetical protein